MRKVLVKRVIEDDLSIISKRILILFRIMDFNDEGKEKAKMFRMN